MKQKVASTAILLFSNIDSQHSKKQLLAKASPSFNARLAQSLFQHTLSVIKKSKIPYFWVRGAEQKGKSFGEKLANAAQKVFSKGYQNVIMLGDDCPGLQVKDLRRAYHYLTHQGNALGLSLDGGVYLIALRKQNFDFHHFSTLNWQSEHLASSLNTLLSTQNTPLHYLESKADVNQSGDLKKALVKIVASHSFKKLLRQLFLPSFFSTLWPQKLPPLRFFLSQILSRPPPLLFS